MSAFSKLLARAENDDFVTWMSLGGIRDFPSVVKWLSKAMSLVSAGPDWLFVNAGSGAPVTRFAIICFAGPASRFVSQGSRGQHLPFMCRSAEVPKCRRHRVLCLAAVMTALDSGGFCLPCGFPSQGNEPVSRSVRRSERRAPPGDVES
jgi:hypothetical protein